MTEDEPTCMSLMEREFKCSSFGLSHQQPRKLVSDQWGFPKLYLVWRLVMAVYHLSWSMYDWITDNQTNERPLTWLIYLTNWTFLLLTIDTVVQAIVVLYVTCARKHFQDGQATPWYLKLCWVMYTLASVASVVVSVLFFALLFNGTFEVVSSVTHLGNSIYVLVDLFITAMPLRLYHVIYPGIYALVYGAFTVIYWAVGGLNQDGEDFIYKPLDYDKPGSAVPLLLGLIFIGTPVFHVILWCLYMLRCAIYRNCCWAESTEVNRGRVNELKPI